MFIEAFVFICPNLETTQVSLHWGKEKETVVHPHTGDYCSAMRRNNMLTHARARRTWKNLKVSVLSDKRWNQRVTRNMVPFRRHSGKGETRGTENSSWVPGVRWD